MREEPDPIEGDGSDNRSIAERLSQESSHLEGHLRRAYRRAARAALLWGEDARVLLAEGRSLTDLRAIGPYLARVLRGWIEEPAAPSPPPPLRRAFLTMSQSRRVLDARPGLRASIRGDLQVHTTWSDGAASIAEMAAAAAGLGHAYVAITDHSKGLPIAGGIGEDELLEQRVEVDAVRVSMEGSGFRVLHAMEVNLDPRGDVDMDADALGRLDLVLGAFHSALRRTDDQTERYLAGLRNPSIQVLAHPRCRIYDHRLGLQADWPRVFAEAATLDKAIEVDACADRQDLDVSLLEQARASGCRISLGSDAHHPRELGVLPLGIAALALARIPVERVVNCLGADELLAWVEGVRERSRSAAHDRRGS